MTASANQFRTYYGDNQAILGVAASAVIYDGTPVGLNGSGYARALAAGDIFAGWNSNGQVTGGTSAGDVKIPLDLRRRVKLTVTGVTSEEDKGKPVYASADDTYTLACGARGGTTCIGHVSQYVSSGVAIVQVDVAADREDNYQHAIPSSVTTAGAATYTAAQLLSGLIKRDPAGSARSDVTPTATLIVAALRPDARRIGYSFEFTLHNIADNSEVITLTAGTDVTLDAAGNWAALDHHMAKRIRVEVTAVASPTVTMYDLGLVVTAH
jgi:hypothetical protein